MRFHVPEATGVFLLGSGTRTPRDVVMVGSARNLRSRLLELVDLNELQELGTRAVHWVADLSIEQARLAERQFIRRYNPPLNAAARSRYLDILAG